MMCLDIEKDDRKGNRKFQGEGGDITQKEKSYKMEQLYRVKLLRGTEYIHGEF